MNKPYDHKEVESKWQKYWEENDTYKTPAVNAGDDTAYVLDMFPYPSGAGLHVGHTEGYTGSDIFSRWLRMKGKKVLHPLGWDAFGLPAENYAIKTGTPPEATTQKAIANFTKQVKSVGLSYDWSRELDTSSPEYYKWTQWIFLQFYKNGLAVKKDAKVNWCNDCYTVLANEQVINGACERCDNQVVQKDLSQWFFKITDYADELISGLDEIEWPESTKQSQRNWIGRSEGAKIKFKVVVDSSTKTESQAQEQLNVVLMHGVEGTGKQGWFSETMDFLESQGVETLALDFPNTNRPKYVEWEEKFKKDVVPKINNNTIFIGHSLAPSFLMRYLSENELNFNKVVFVAPVLYSKIKKIDSFFEKSFNWGKIKSAINEIIIIGSDNDPYIPVEDFEELADKLSAKFILYKGREHFSQADKHNPEIIELLEEILSHKKQAEVADLEVFTTRPDTLFGATYMVVAPEHSLITEQKDKIKNWQEVEDYLEDTAKKTELERTSSTEKTGVRIDGLQAVNPTNDEVIPIFVADYVLGGYGTGAIMAVPAHDERDYEFAKKFGVEIRQVIVPETGTARSDSERRDGGCAIIFDPEKQKYAVAKNPDGHFQIYGGGIDSTDKNPQEGVLREVREESGFHNFIHIEQIGIACPHYYNLTKKIYRHAVATCLLLILNDTDRLPLQLEPHETFELEWVTPDEMLDNWKEHSRGDGTFDHYRWFLYNAVERAIELGYDNSSNKDKYTAKIHTQGGMLTGSGKFDGMSSEEAKQAITEFVGGEMTTTYRLRDWLISRQRYWGCPIPIVYSPEGEPQAVPEEHLPWLLPTDVEFKPTGVSPLALSKELKERTEKLFGKGWTPEVDTLDTFMDSSWYFLRFTDPHNEKEFASAEEMKKWLPVDTYIGGAEHSVLHLLYARFFTKALRNLGYLNFSEPFKKLRHPGMVLAEGGAKMSKSKGNTVNPNDVVATVGADTLRVYEMFMGPFDQAVEWNTDNVAGSRRFLDRFFWTVNEQASKQATKTDKSTKHIIEKTIDKVGKDIDNFNFNTAISQMMIMVGEVRQAEQVSLDDLQRMVLVLAPFAPHLAEEMWQEVLGQEGSVHQAKWPEVQTEWIKDDVVTIGVQVNGKVRGDIEIAVDASEDEALQLAKAQAGVIRHIDSKDIKKVIYIPSKILNILV